jgi:hypothetical protein
MQRTGTMERTKTYGLALGTAICAFGIGYVMQFGIGLPGDPPPQSPLSVTAITDTAAPVAPAEAPARAQMGPHAAAFGAGSDADSLSAAAHLDVAAKAGPSASARSAAPSRPSAAGMVADAVPLLHRAAFAAEASQPDSAAPAAAADPNPDCAPRMTAMPLAGAMVRLDLTAPCHGGERVTLHHSGLTVTEITETDGSLRVDMPALAEQALYIATFADEAGAIARTDVTSLPFYDRVVLQWDGAAAGLELHAREFGAEYFGPGHIWREAPGSLEAAARGEGGFLTRLGNPDLPSPRLAEIYSFPAGTTQRDGDIQLSVEAEIGADSCGSDVSAQTMILREGEVIGGRDVVLAVPDCSAVGDFLVLKNLVDDLKIASD